MSKTSKAAASPTGEKAAANAQYQLDALAFLLSATPDSTEDALMRPDPTAAVPTTEDFTAWQSNRDRRTEYRKLARDFVAVLESMGMRIKLSNSALLQKTIKSMTTIPEQQAYDPDLETV